MQPNLARTLTGLLIASLAAWPLLAHAEAPPPPPGNTGLKIAPTQYTERIEPGQNKDGELDVFNISEGPVTVTPDVENVQMTGEHGDLSFYKGDNPYRLHTLVQLDRTPFTLQPGQAQHVKFRIAIPAGLYPGGYFASILFTVSPGAASGAAAIGQSGRIGSLLLINIGGDGDQRGSIERWKITKNAFGGPKAFEALYANTGSTTARPLGVAYRPVGELRIKDSVGITVRKQKVTGETVFPDAKRQINLTASKPFWLGRYTAELSLSPGEGKPAETKRVTFWAASPLALVLLAGLLLLVLLVVWRRRAGRLRPEEAQSVSLMDEATKYEGKRGRRAP